MLKSLHQRENTRIFHEMQKLFLESRLALMKIQLSRLIGWQCVRVFQLSTKTSTFEGKQETMSDLNEH